MNTQSENRPEFGPITRFAFLIMGVNKAWMALCASVEANATRLRCALAAGVCVFQATVFSAIAHLLLGVQGVAWHVVLFGAFIASIVLLLDSQIFAESHFLHGIEGLKRGGLVIPGSAWIRAKSFIFLAVRLALSFVTSMLTAIMLGVLAFSTDIGSKIDQTYLQRNTELFNAAAARVDEDLRKNAEARAQVANTIARVEDEQARLRETTVNPSLENPELKLLLDRVARLEQMRVGAEQALIRARNFTINELGGLSGEAGNSTIAGEGPKWRAGMERIKVAEGHLRDATKALAEAQERLRQVQEATETETQARRKTIEDRLAEVGRSKQAQEARLSELEEAYRQLTENRERIIWESVRRDPSFVPKDEGFLARVRALQKLSEDHPAVFWVILLFELGCFGIELSAILAQVTVLVGGEYSLMVAKEEYVRAVRAAQEVADQVAAARAPRYPPPPPGGTPNAVPENPGGTGPSTSTPPRRRGRPPGPTWRPKVWTPSGEGSPA